MPASRVVKGGAAAVRDAEKSDPNARRWPRINLSAQARLQFETLGPEVSGHILNVSERGLFLKMSRPRPVGTTIRLKVMVASPPMDFSISGVVVHIVNGPSDQHDLPNGMGVFLTEVDEKWTSFCRALAAQQNGPTQTRAEG